MVLEKNLKVMCTDCRYIEDVWDSDPMLFKKYVDMVDCPECNNEVKRG